jgi:hypothetical protein
MIVQKYPKNQGGRKSMKKKSVLRLIVFACVMTFFSPNLYAFNSTSAVQYADTWALSRNSNYPSFSSDCTNYVSQIMEAGGIAEIKSGSNQWYCDPGTLWGFNYTTSWSVANDCKNWIINAGKGYLTATWDWNPNTSNPQPVDNSANLGGGKEVIFYDWDSNGTIDHAAFCVATGDSSDGKGYGDLIDQHTTDRKRVKWHLKDYNSAWSTTTIKGIVLY